MLISQCYLIINNTIEGNPVSIIIFILIFAIMGIHGLKNAKKFMKKKDIDNILALIISLFFPVISLIISLILTILLILLFIN